MAVDQTQMAQPATTAQAVTTQTATQIVETAVSGESKAIVLDALGIVNVLVVAGLLVLGYLLVSAVSFGSGQAQRYLADLFSPSGLLGSALAAAGYALYRVIPKPGK